MPISTRPNSNLDSSEALFVKKILVVDDDPLTAKAVAAHLRHGGFQNVMVETDPRDVIDALGELKPDMLLLDIFMPHISGLDLLKTIRAESRFDDTVVLMLSSAGRNEKYQALEMGAIGFVQKPASPEEIIDTILKSFRMAQRFGAR